MKMCVKTIFAAGSLVALALGSSLAVGTEPFLELKLNTVRALQAVEKIVPPEALKDEEFLAKLATARDLRLGNAFLFLYEDEDFGSLPVLILQGQDAEALQALVAADGPLGPRLEKSTSTSYKIKPPPPEEGEESEEDDSVPIEEYRVWVTGELLLCAPMAIVKSWKAGAPRPMASRVAKAVASLPSKQHIIACAVQLPDDVGEKDWEEVAGELPVPAGEQSDVLLTVGSELLDEMSDAFSTISSFAFGFDLAGTNNTRVVDYAQRFSADADVSNLFKQIIGSGGDSESPADLIAVLRNVMQMDGVNVTPGLNGNDLSLKLAWDQPNDETVVEAIGGYLMGRVISAAMGGMMMEMGASPDDGPIETRYIPEPKIQAGMTRATLEASLRREILAKLFRGNYFSHGDKPHMQMMLDPLDLPNVDLTKITYAVTSVTTPDGMSVMRPDDRDLEKWGPREVHMSRSMSSSIQFPVKKDTPAEQLGAGVLHVDIEAPLDIVVFEFGKEDIGSQKQDGSVRVKLRSIEKNSISVSYEGGEKTKVLAFDATGGCISSSSGMSSGGSMSRNYNGMVERIKVVVAREMATFGMDFTCDLSGGQKEELPEEPDDSVRPRYETRMAPAYANYTEADFADVQVEMKEAGERGWQDKLSITLPRKPFSGSAKWAVLLMDDEKDVCAKGDSQISGDELAFSMEKGSLASVRAATGMVKIRVNTGIETLSFAKKAAGEMQEQTLPSGKTVSVGFDKNLVLLKADDCKVLQSRAYDKAGRVLKPNWRSHSKGKTYWGLPVRYEIDIADASIEKKIPFTLTKDAVEKPELDAFEMRAQTINAVAGELKALQKLSGKTSWYEYDDTVAGFYYLYDRNGKPRTEKLIPEVVAHSDPAGAERYGYTAQPYKGYLFSRLKGTIKRDGTKQDNRTRTKPHTYKWDGGEFQLNPLSQPAGFVAIPKDPAMPTICTSWGDLYVRYRNGEKTEYLEESLYDSEWTQLHVVE